MAYDKEHVITMALAAITENGIRKITEVPTYLPISQATFYEWELEKSELILQKIYDEKIKRKAKMRKKWVESDNPALQIAAYKLEGDEEEIAILTTTKTENKHKIEELPSVSIVIDDSNRDECT